MEWDPLFVRPYSTTRPRGLVPETNDAVVLADLNRDGQTNVFDAILVLQDIVGIAPISECGPP